VRLLREPLIHFLAIGVVLFVAQRAAPDRDAITVGAAEIAALQARWTQQRGRPPTVQELNGLIESRIREEVLYREALAMGLDRDDVIVRRRLAQKLEFLITDAAVGGAPDEAALRTFFEAKQERYAEPARRSFRHVYFSVDRRGDHAVADAESALAELTGVDPPSASDLGDGFMLGHDFARLSETEVARQLGSRFASALFAIEADGWQGPIRSGYGLHLVRIDAWIEARPAELEAVRSAVERDYLAERAREVDEQAYERLRARYEVMVEKPSGALAAAP
jgi:peptidyl-prolyl cis-trans isomerase C